MTADLTQRARDTSARLTAVATVFAKSHQYASTCAFDGAELLTALASELEQVKRERDEARLLAEHYRLAMLEAERLIRAAPMPASEVAIAVNPVSQAASNAAAVLWQARQDAIYGKFSTAAKNMTAIAALQPETESGN